MPGSASFSAPDILFREYRDRTLSHFSSAPDLEHTLSPSYVRGALRRGREIWALIAAPPDLSPSATDQILSFGLIWFDHLRSRETDYVFAGLKIFVPQGRARSTANRLAWLNPHVLQSELIEYDRTGRIRRFDKQDYGNLATELRPCLSEAATEEHVAAWLQSVSGAFPVSRRFGVPTDCCRFESEAPLSPQRGEVLLRTALRIRRPSGRKESHRSFDWRESSPGIALPTHRTSRTPSIDAIPKRGSNHKSDVGST